MSLLDENLIGLRQAAQSLPPGRSDRPVNASTLFRWCRDGVRSPRGELVRLECCRLGGRWLTSLEAISRFSQRLTPDFSKTIPMPRSTANRKRHQEAVSRKLDEIGI
jgi:hypothetical protein